MCSVLKVRPLQGQQLDFIQKVVIILRRDGVGELVSEAVLCITYYIRWHPNIMLSM